MAWSGALTGGRHHGALDLLAIAIVRLVAILVFARDLANALRCCVARALRAACVGAHCVTAHGRALQVAERSELGVEGDVYRRVELSEEIVSGVEVDLNTRGCVCM
jgi:hypothetical protein